MRKEQNHNDEIAIVGISCMLPQANGADEFWNNIIDGKDCIVEIGKEKWKEPNFYDTNLDAKNKINSKWIGEVNALKEFDHKFFNVSPAEADNMDPDQRVLLQETWKCIEDSGISLQTLQEKKTSVIVGTAEVDTFGNQHMLEYEINAFSGKGTFYFMIPNRISWYYGFTGESKLIETGCPSGLCALNDGVNLLKLGKSDFAIVSGVNTFKTSHMLKLMTKNGLFSSDGKCKTFSADADGIVVSEGVVSILLAPLSVAKKNNCHIYGVIKNTAVNHAGSTFSITAPKVSAQKDMIFDAWKGLEFSPDTINYIETHGTGTSLGDPIEVQALREAYEKVTDKKNFCWIGSVKPNIGHSLPVSGLAGVVKVIKMFEHKVIPGQINISEINPLINIENSPFGITTKNVIWEPVQEHLPLRAGVTCLGFAGVNAHIVLEEYKESDHTNLDQDTSKEYPFVLSAKTEESLVQLLDKWNEKAKCIEENHALNDISYTLCNSREQFKYRVAGILNNGMKINQSLVNFKDNIHKVTDKKSLFDISFINKEMIQNKLLTIIKENSIFEKELLSNTEKLGISKNEIYDSKCYPSEEIYDLVISTVYVRGILEIADNLDGIYFETEDKKILALFIAGIINVEDVNSYLFDCESAKSIIAKRPSMLVNFKNKVIFKKDTVSNRDVANLLAHLSLEFKESETSQTLSSVQWLDSIRLLYKYQRTFIKYINEMNQVFLKLSTFDLKEFICKENIKLDDIEDMKLRFMVILAINIASKRLYKKWSLNPDDVFVDNRMNELSDLILQGYITFENTVELYQEGIQKEQNNEFYHTLKDILALSNSMTHQGHENFNILKGMEEKNTLKEQLIELWLHGATIDWKKGFQFDNGKLISLPTYCFHKKSFRMIQQDIDFGETNEPELQIKVVDYIKKELEEEQQQSQKILVFSNLERSYFKQLYGQEVVFVKLGSSSNMKKEQFEIRPELVDDCYRLFDEIGRMEFHPDVVLVALDDYDESRQKDDYVLCTLLFAANLAKCLIQKNNCSGKILFGSMGRESRTYSEGLTALFKTIQIEYDALYFRNITCYGQSIDEFIASLGKEINYFSASEYKVTYQGFERMVQTYKEFQPSESIPYLKNNGTYVLLGGFGAIGKIIVKHFLDNAHVSLVLCGRREENEAIREFIASFNQDNVTIIYKSIDVARKEQLHSLITDVVNSFGTIDGIINMTGYIKPDFIESKSTEFLREAIKLKVDATVFLDEITKDMNLDFFVNFSSISAILGDFGLSEYVYENCFFDEFIKRRESLRKEGKRHGNSISINWPYWHDGGLRMTEKVAKRFSETTGLSPITNEEALSAFDRIMKNNQSLQYCVLFGNDKKMNEYLNRQLYLPTMQHMGTALPLEYIKIDVKELVEQYIIAVIAQELSLSTEEFDTEDSFQSLGIDSIVIHKLNRVIATHFSGISPTIFYDCRDIDELVEYFLKTYTEEQLKNALASNENHSENRESKPMMVESTHMIKKVEDVDHQQKAGVDKEQNNNKDVAIIGMSGCFPMAKNIEEFWSSLVDGKDCISEIPEGRWDVEEFYDEEAKNSFKGKMNSRWGGFIDEIDQFDPLLFQISPLDAGNMDPQERMFLEVVYEAFENAGYSKKRIQDKVAGSVGVFVGNTTNGYRLLIEDEMEKGNTVTHQALPWSIANRVSYVFELNGPSFVIDSACSSSLNSIVIAVDNIRNGKCKMAVAGGVNLHIHPSEYVLRSQLRMLSPKGKCHSFGSEADGYVPGEGIGAIILKPLTNAERDGDHILGVIKGVASNHVGHPNGYTVPSSASQAAVIQAAIEDAHLSSRDITLIEAHGTGTILGDPIEIKGLKSAFSAYTNEQQYCAIGSVKSNIGHLEGAAGIAATIKSVLQLMNRVKVPLINCETTNSGISLADSQFYLQKAVEPWYGYKNKLVVGVSAFGAGGSNAHIIIQNYEDKRTKANGTMLKQYPVFLSEMTDEGLQKYAEKMVHWIDTDQAITKGTISIQDVAYTTQVGRDLLSSRICVLCHDFEDLKFSLLRFLNQQYSPNVLIHLASDKSTVSKADRIQYTEMAKVAMETGNTEEIAKVAMRGIRTDWEQYNLLQNGVIVTIPTYVFDNQRYWINITAQNEKGTSQSISSKSARLSFLIDENISTIECQRFTRHIHQDEFFVKDHIIDGQVLMPGTAMIEMAIEAGNLSLTSQQINAIEDIKYHKAIEMNEPSIELQIDIIPEDYYLQFEIYRCGNEERLLCTEGKLVISNTENNVIHLPSVESMVEVNSNDYYKWLDTLGFQFKDSFKSIERLFINRDIVMSEVYVTEINQYEKASNCILWPPLIDGALQSTFKLVEPEIETGFVALPVSIGKLIMHKSTIGNLITFAQISKNYVRGNSDFIFNIFIFNEDGELALEVYDYRLVKLKKKNHDSKEHDDTDALLLEVIRRIKNGEIDRNLLLNPDLFS